MGAAAKVSRGDNKGGSNNEGGISVVDSIWWRQLVGSVWRGQLGAGNVVEALSDKRGW